MASLNNSLIFFSASPTYLLITSGPLTILGSLHLNTFDSYFAIKVFPVPGGPYRITPFICLTPYFYRISFGNRREANALLKMLLSSLSKPPIPMSSNLKSLLKMLFI
jgi:hypothetical protein